MINMNTMEVQLKYVGHGTVGREWSKTKFPDPHHRIYYITHGEATLTLNDSSQLLTPGRLYLIPAFSIVETTCEDSLSHCFCHFFLQHRGMIDLFSLYDPVLELPAPRDAKDLFDKLEATYQQDTPYSMMVTHSSFFRLLAPFFESCTKPDASLLRFEPVLNYIDNNLDLRIKNEDLAKMLDLETVYFTNLFSKVLGLPPTQYIIKKRLEKAQRLLLSTNLKVVEIATLAGFDNPIYFSRLFKKKLNTTPLTYRRTYRHIN